MLDYVSNYLSRKIRQSVNLNFGKHDTVVLFLLKLDSFLSKAGCPDFGRISAIFVQLEQYLVSK